MVMAAKELESASSQNSAIAAQSRPWRRRRRLNPMVALFALGVLIGAVVIAGIAQSITIAELQYRLDDLNKRFDDAQQLNQYLQLQSAQLQSLDRIEAIARQELNMVKPAQVKTIVLTPELPISGTAVAATKTSATERPNKYLVSAARLLGRILPALDQAEAGKLGD